jgi:hypothetical protein
MVVRRVHAASAKGSKDASDECAYQCKSWPQLRCWRPRAIGPRRESCYLLATVASMPTFSGIGTSTHSEDSKS